MSSNKYDDHQSNDAYWKGFNCRYSCSEEEKKVVRPSEAELTKQRFESYQQEQNSERRDGLQTLVKTLIIILIDSLVFLIHWFIAKRSRF